MVKHTQTTRRQKPTNWLSVFDNFVELALKGLNVNIGYIGGHLHISLLMLSELTSMSPEIIDLFIYLII